MLRPARALLHPLWLVALALHALNDHVLKGSGFVPEPLTGKLSDVAVLVVTPTVLATIAGVRTRRGWAGAHLTMGALFVLLELSPGFTSWWASLIGLLGFRWVTWSDWTDLLTLPALMVSHTVLGRTAAHRVEARVPRRLGEAALIATSSLVCVATSDIDCPGPEVVDRDEDRDGVGWTRDCDDRDAARSPLLPDALGDGVDADCDGFDGTPVPAPNPCADVVQVQLDAPVVVDTRDAAAHDGPSCAPGDAPTARLQVYPFGPPGTAIGWLTVEITADAPHAIAAYTACPSVGAELACEDAPATSVRVLVAAGAPATLALRPEGAGSLVDVIARFEPLVCGDGVITAPETCDDGNTTSGDGCDAICRDEGTDA